MQPSKPTNLWLYPCYRRSPFFAATQKAGCQGYDIYNHMLLPAGYAETHADRTSAQSASATRSAQ